MLAVVLAVALRRLAGTLRFTGVLCLGAGLLGFSGRGGGCRRRCVRRERDPERQRQHHATQQVREAGLDFRAVVQHRDKCSLWDDFTDTKGSYQNSVSAAIEALSPFPQKMHLTQDATQRLPVARWAPPH